MFIARLLILLIVVAILLWLLKRLFSSDTETQTPESGEAENMRQCKYCGVHVPESSIIVVNEQPYCSQQHADLDQR
jgi:uncharacterized protein